MIEEMIDKAARGPFPPAPLEAPSKLFDAEYFQSGFGALPYDRTHPYWLDRMADIAENLIRSIRPRKVLDAGCALGFLVEAFRDRGVDAWGIDISEFAIENVRRDIRAHCKLASLVQPIGERYDLIVCIDVMGCVPESQSRAVLRNLTAAADTLLFSESAGALTWIELFEEHGFAPDIGFDAGFVAPQAILFKRLPALSADTARLFSECLRWRQKAAEHPREAMETAKSAELDRLTNELARRDDRVAHLEAQLLREREYLHALRSVQTHLMREAERVRDLPPVNVPAAVFDPSALNALESRLRAEFAERERVAALEQSALIASRIEEIGNSVNRLDLKTESILTSRIWRSLAYAGGFLLRLAPHRSAR